jgi:uncharacterized integral membrane protein
MSPFILTPSGVALVALYGIFYKEYYKSNLGKIQGFRGFLMV